MGTNLPAGRRQSLVWIESHIGQWNTNFASIGLTSAQVIDLAQDVVNTRSGFTSVQQIRDDAKASTQTWYSAADALHAKTADLITIIKSHAANNADPDAVYQAAGMTPKDPPSPLPAPSQPVITTAILDGSGAVTIKWDATGPVGTVYVVSRKLSTQSGFTIVGQGDGKEYTDLTIPNGTPSAIYMVRGVRGTVSGPNSGVFTVLLGNLPDQGTEEMGLAA